MRQRNKNIFLFSVFLSSGTLFTLMLENSLDNSISESVLKQNVTSLKQVFVCMSFLGERCPLATMITEWLFPNVLIQEYFGQVSTPNDMLISVCGCNQADLFEGIIVYIDNGFGKLYLPGVKEQRVVYIGVHSPEPQSLISVQYDSTFAVVAYHLLMNSRIINNIGKPRKSSVDRMFLIYLRNYFFEELKATSFYNSLNNKVKIFGYASSSIAYLDIMNNTLLNFENIVKKMSNYRFCLISENRYSDGYVGEKITLCFLAGCIPIYSGVIDVFKIFNRHSFIYLDAQHQEAIMNDVINAHRDEQIYSRYLNQRIFNPNNGYAELFSYQNVTYMSNVRSNIIQSVIKGQNKLKSCKISTSSNILYKEIVKRQLTRIPFFMYEEKVFSLDELNHNCSIAKSMSDYDKTDITLLRLFQNHQWRTRSESEAKIFIISTPLMASYVCQPKQHIKRTKMSLSTIMSTQTYKENFGRNHLIMSHNWRFGSWWPKPVMPVGLWTNLSNVTCIRNEYFGSSHWENFSSNDKRRVPVDLYRKKYEQSKRTIVVPYNIGNGIEIATSDFQAWNDRKHFFWYHTRKSFSWNGGFEIRQLPIRKQQHFPGDIGFDIDRTKWKLGWANSKFCLILRGDTPSTHAFSNALATSCIPVIVSDTFELVAMPFRDLIPVKSIAIQFSEKAFLQKPETLVPYLQSIPQNVIKTILYNIKFVQPALILTHINCTLPNLILHEMKDKMENIFNIH